MSDKTWKWKTNTSEPAVAAQGQKDETDIIERLKTACNGHPYAQIPWPHRLLHDAIDEITRLRVGGSPARSVEAQSLMDWIGETLKSFEVWKCEQTEVATADLADHIDQMEDLYIRAGGKLK